MSASQKQWSAERVIKTIQRRYQNGWRLNSSYVQKKCGKLFRSANYYFGNWKTAVESAWVPYEEVTTKMSPGFWTHKKVKNNILDLYNQGAQINAREAMLKHTALYKAAYKLYGSWRKAIKAAGINYQEILLTDPKKWTKKKIKEEIQKRIASGKSLRTTIKDKEFKRLVNIAQIKFGSWAKAIKAAGFNPYQYIQRQKYWTKEKVISKLKKRYKKSKGLTKSALLEEDSSLYDAALRLFKTRVKALRSAGIDPETVDTIRTWTKEKVIKEIQRIYENGESITSSYVQRHHTDLYMAAKNRFKNWKEVLAAAGFSYSNHRIRRNEARWVASLNDNKAKEVLDRAVRMTALEFTKKDKKEGR